MRISAGWVIVTIFDRNSLKNRLRELSRRFARQAQQAHLRARRPGADRARARIHGRRGLSALAARVGPGVLRAAAVGNVSEVRMPGPRPWTTLESEPIQDCRVFSVRRIRTRSPRTGDAHDFFAIDSSDWVNVVPITPDGRVVMVRQYRHGAGELTLETPGGLVDPGETPAAAAARELLEETGYAADEIVSLGAVSPESGAVQQSPARLPRARRAARARGAQREHRGDPRRARAARGAARGGARGAREPRARDRGGLSLRAGLGSIGAGAVRRG